MAIADSNLFFQPLHKTSVDDPVIYGVISTAMTAFTAVMLDPSVEDPKTLIAANGIQGFFVERDIIADDQAGRDRLLREQVFNNEITPPHRVGNTVTAVWYQRIAVESTDYLDASLTAGTADNTPVCFKAGKIADQTANPLFEIVGYIRRQVTVLDSANAVRFEIEMTR
jgi:hypothetical protein